MKGRVSTDREAVLSAQQGPPGLLHARVPAGRAGRDLGCATKTVWAARKVRENRPETWLAAEREVRKCGCWCLPLHQGYLLASGTPAVYWVRGAQAF